MRNLGAQFLALAEKQGATVPLMIGHRMMGMSLACTGDIAEGRAHFDQALVLYEPAEHRSARDAFWPRCRCGNLVQFGRWLFGFLAIPDAALADTDHALNDARR